MDRRLPAVMLAAGIVLMALAQTGQRISIAASFLGPIAATVGVASLLHPPLLFGIGPRRHSLPPKERLLSQGIYVLGVLAAAVHAQLRWQMFW